MREIGFAAAVRVITKPEPVPALAREPAYAAVEEAHGGIHLPGPSTWPLLLAASSLISFGGILVWTSTLLVTAIGMVLVFISIVGWGLEPI
jgi:cytochrome c oxidase subunit I